MKKVIVLVVLFAGFNVAVGADKLTNELAQKALVQWDQHVVNVIGVVDLPAQGAATVDFTVKDFILILPKNDAVTAYAFGPGGGQRLWSGQMQAVFKHYNDGRWLLVEVNGAGFGWQPADRNIFVQ